MISVTVLHADGRRSEQEIEPKLEEFQRLVDGPIEPLHVDGKVWLVNEEGLLKQLPPNSHFPDLVGDIVVVEPKDFR